MLPPVRAALSSTADYQSQAQAAVTSARVIVSPKASQSQTENDTTLSGARLDAASLSAQLKLAQGSSILAETIGKLLKTPRGENESLLDYTARLFEVVQRLKPQEIANVERLLNQIVKGISLRLMAEILKEPVGPIAARLAAHMEVANIAQRDLAAKTVVSFYRQNGSTDASPNGNSPRLPQTGAPAAATPVSQAGKAPAAPTVNEIASPRQPTTNDGVPKLAEGQNQRPSGSPNATTSMPVTIKPDQLEHIAKSARDQSNTVPPATPNRIGTTTNEITGATRQVIFQPALPPTPQPNLVRAESDFGKPGMATAIPGNQALTAAAQVAQPATTPEPDEMQALARTAMEMFKRDMPVPARLWSALSDQTLLKLANWLAMTLSELDLPETPHLPASPAAMQTAAEGKPVDQQRPANSQQQPASQQSGQAAAPSQTANGSAADTARLAATLPRADTTEQYMAAMASAASALPTQTREALPWPYVAAYPPADDEEPRREQRRPEPIEAIEDEEQDGSSQQHAFGDEPQQESEQPQEDAQNEENATETMTKAERAAGYRAGEARIEADAPEARPSDLYWRMAGWA